MGGVGSSRLKKEAEILIRVDPTGARRDGRGQMWQ